MCVLACNTLIINKYVLVCIILLIVIVECCFYWLIFRERETDLLLHLFIHSLVDSWMCPDWDSNPQPWQIGMMVWPTQLSGLCEHTHIVPDICVIWDPYLFYRLCITFLHGGFIERERALIYRHFSWVMVFSSWSFSSTFCIRFYL